MVSPKLHHAKKLYQRLLLLETLEPFRGEKAASGCSDRDTRFDLSSVRRQFVHSIAYICAYSRASKYVTAAALQDSSTVVTVWLAGNEDIEHKVLKFLGSTLNDLTKVARLDRRVAVDRAELLRIETLLPNIIAFETPRLHGYFGVIVEKYLSRCLKVLKDALAQESHNNEDVGGLSALQKWLEQRFLCKPSNAPCGAELEVLVRDCYEIRRSPHVKEFLYLCAQGQKGHQDFQLLYKLLGKLGRPVIISISLATAATVLVDEFAKGFGINTVPCQPSRLKALSKDDTVEDAINSILSSSEKTGYLARLRFLNGDNTSNILQQRCEVKTRVHAELLLLDFFYKRKYKFIGNDRYIACSKPACFLCSAYISNHPGDFMLPPSHYKIYKNWRTPNTDLEVSKFLELDKSLLAAVDKRVERELLAEINSSEPKRPFQADSPG